MKAILISIKPKYVADILNHKKTIEIRKTMPKCDLPIDVYIYCCKPRKYEIGCHINFKRVEGTVVAKFTLNKVEEISKYQSINPLYTIPACLTAKEWCDYLGEKYGYAWHISNLEIFNKPKELSEFYAYCKDEKCEYRNNHCSICHREPLTKAPQSMCYVESEK